MRLEHLLSGALIYKRCGIRNLAVKIDGVSKLFYALASLLLFFDIKKKENLKMGTGGRATARSLWHPGAGNFFCQSYSSVG